MADLYGENWMAIVAASVVITWVVGLTPPLLIRFTLLKKPVGKGGAFFLCFMFFMMNLVFFTWLGSESKTHGALALVAFVSFFIFTYKKKSKSDIEKENMDKELTDKRKEQNQSDWSNH